MPRQKNWPLGGSPYPRCSGCDQSCWRGAGRRCGLKLNSNETLSLRAISPAQDTPATPRRVDSLEGIRGLCILAVMGHHFGFCDPGWIGVEMFFVLSGFLITTLLCRENDQNGGVALPQFWARRAFRLLPIYWLYIGGVTIAILLRRPGDWASKSPWSPGLFIASLWANFINIAPAGVWVHQYLTWHLWSLAVEEQFC
jgi:peptidoglycan/LPS O-acetylase OafA/YrhL